MYLFFLFVFLLQKRSKEGKVKDWFRGSIQLKPKLLYFAHSPTPGVAASFSGSAAQVLSSTCARSSWISLGLQKPGADTLKSLSSFGNFSSGTNASVDLQAPFTQLSMWISWVRFLVGSWIKNKQTTFKTVTLHEHKSQPCQNFFSPECQPSCRHAFQSASDHILHPLFLFFLKMLVNEPSWKDTGWKARALGGKAVQIGKDRKLI